MYLVTTILVFMTIFLVIHEEMEPGKKAPVKKSEGASRKKIAMKKRRGRRVRQEATL